MTRDTTGAANMLSTAVPDTTTLVIVVAHLSRFGGALRSATG
jgi:hypothetical protein